jgi:hypothetical protein
MNAFFQVTAPAGKRVLLLHSDQLIQLNQTGIAQAAIESIGQERFCFIAQNNLRTTACRNIFGVTGKFLFAAGTYFQLTTHHH